MQWEKAMRGELKWRSVYVCMFVCVIGHGAQISAEKQVMLVLLLIEQLAVGWLYSVNATNVFAAAGRYNLSKAIQPNFL